MIDVDIEAELRTRRAKVGCLQRELAMRRRVYPGRVQAGRMKQAEADHEIETIASILDDYQTWGFGSAGGVEFGRRLAAETTEREVPLL